MHDGHPDKCPQPQREEAGAYARGAGGMAPTGAAPENGDQRPGVPEGGQRRAPFPAAALVLAGARAKARWVISRFYLSQAREPLAFFLDFGRLCRHRTPRAKSTKPTQRETVGPLGPLRTVL